MIWHLFFSKLTWLPTLAAMNLRFSFKIVRVWGHGDWQQSASWRTFTMCFDHIYPSTNISYSPIMIIWNFHILSGEMQRLLISILSLEPECLHLFRAVWSLTVCFISLSLSLHIHTRMIIMMIRNINNANIFT
jgi:hypothetical protein